jgi:ABC-type transport system involved in multi-copper enzyme maturation permease subunit
MSARGASGLFSSLPLLRRELLALLRGRREFWLLVLVVAVSFCVPLYNWGTVVSLARRGSRNADVVATFLFAQLAAVLLAIAVAMATSISGERERGTWDCLVMTRLSPLEIVLSKLGAALAFAGLLFIASAPGACTLYLLGGTSFGAVLSAYAVSFQTALVAACCSMCVSAHTARTSHAVASGVLLTFWWSIIPEALMAMVLGGMLIVLLSKLFGSLLRRRKTVLGRLLGGFLPTGIAAIIVGWLYFTPCMEPMALSPFGLIRTSVLEAPAVTGMVLYPIVVLLSCTGLCWLAAWQVPRPIVPPPPRTQESFALTVNAWLVAAQRRLARSGLARRLADGESALGALSRNPVFLKDGPGSFLGAVTFHSRSFLFTLLFLIVVAMGSLMEIWDVPRTVCVAASALCLIVPAGFAAIWLGRETAQGSFDALRSTTLEPREILAGELLASIQCLPGVLAATAVCLGLCALMYLYKRWGLEDVTRGVLQDSSVAASYLPLMVLGAVYGAAAGILASVAAVRALPALLLACALCAAPVIASLWLPRSLATRWWLPLMAAGALALAAVVLWMVAGLWFRRFRTRDR